jgi:hypothetical protein
MKRNEVSFRRRSTGAALTRLHRRQLQFATACVVSLLALQRIALPLGGGRSVPLVLPLVLALAVLAVVSGILEVDRDRTILVAAALGCCGAVTLFHLAHGGGGSSLSYLYLVFTYVPFFFVLIRPSPVVVDRIFARFQIVMLVMAAIGIAQMAVQLLGVTYSDLLATALPKAFLVPGYHTTYPVVYGSPLYKSNAYLFLEPSFLSQALGAAIVLTLARGRSGWRTAAAVLVYVVALVTTVAGTGIALAVVGTVLVLSTRSARAVIALVGPLVVGIAVAVATPIGAILVRRLSEPSDPNSSASLRFIQPFTVILRSWSEDVSSMLLGRGPGAVERFVVALTGSTSLQGPAPVKLLFDYGGVAAIVFLVTLGWCVFARAPLVPFAGALAFGYLLLSAALLQPVTVLLLWLFTSALSGLDVGRKRILHA